MNLLSQHFLPYIMINCVHVMGVAFGKLFNFSEQQLPHVKTW